MPMGRIRDFLNRTIVPRTLLLRSLLIVVLPLLFLQIVLTVVFYNRHWDTVTRWLAAGVAGEVALLGEQLTAADGPVDRARILDQAMRRLDLNATFQENGSLDLTVALGEVGGAFTTHIDRKILEAFEERRDTPCAVDLGPSDPDQIAVYVQLPNGLLTVETQRRRVTSTTTWLLLAWMVGASLVLLAVAIYYMSLQVRPIRRLARAADNFGKGRDPGDFRIEGASEIRRAARAFNLMRQRILRFMGQRTEMLAAVSHDLRTPLTNIRGYAEAIADGATAPADGATVIRRESDRLDRLVRDLLDLARLDARQFTLHPTLVDLAAVTRDAAGSHRAEVEGLLTHGVEVVGGLAEVDAQGHHLGVVLVLDPFEHDRGVQPPRIQQHHSVHLVGLGEIPRHGRGGALLGHWLPPVCGRGKSTAGATAADRRPTATPGKGIVRARR